MSVPLAKSPSAGEQTKSATSSKVSLDTTTASGGNREDSIGAASPLDLRDSNEAPSSLTDPDHQSLTRQGDKSHRPNSMKSAMKSSLSRSSSRSSSPNRQVPHRHRSLPSSQAGQISLEAAVGAGKSIKQIVGAGLKSPMDFTLSLARGFHNAPKLYGDESVRQADKVTGLQSGLKAAGKVCSV